MILWSLFLIFSLPGKYGISQLYHSEKLPDTDSLENVLLQAGGEDRIGVLCELSRAYRILKPSRSLDLAKEAYQLSASTEDPKARLQATYILGLAYHHNGDYPNAIGYSFDARPLSIQLKDTLALYRITECIVLSYLYSHNYDLAIEHTLAAYEFLGPMTDPVQNFDKYIRIGWVYRMSGKDSAAIPYFRRAAEYSEASERVPVPGVILNYNHLAGRYLNIGNYDSARYFLNRADTISEKSGVDFDNYILLYRGDYYYLTQKPDSAVLFYQMALQHAREQGDIAGQGSNLGDLGKIFRLTGAQERAIACFREMLEKGAWIREHRSLYLDPQKTYDYWYSPEQSVPNFMERTGLSLLMDGHRNLYEIYKSISDYGQALAHLEAYNEVAERSRELNRMMEVSAISTRYETERKEQQILLLTSEKELTTMKLEQSQYFLFALAGFILLVILVAVLLIRQNRMRALQDKTILEQRLFRAQMNPHFLFNTLGSIQGYMLEHDIDRANHYLSRFSRLMRNILDNTAHDAIPLEEEISTIENYLELQKIRYPGKFEYRIDLDENLDPEGTFIPPMLAQPFIENAVEHGIKHLQGSGMITVGIRPDPLTAGPAGKLLLIEISDNGVGREQSAQLEHDRYRKHRPMATSITRERLNVLSRKAPRRIRKHIRLQIEDLYSGDGEPSGTRVRIRVFLSRP